MQKVERLVNLIALLLNARRPLTVDEIRNTVPGYQQEDYTSFKRMFERDKEELRAVGIPVERQFTDVWEVEEGYLIPKDRYYLPELDLTPDEVAALWIASQIMVEPGAKEDQALLKLSLGSGVQNGPESPGWLRARLHLDAAALPSMLEGVAARRQVRFTHKTPGRTRQMERVVDPYALIHRQGAWYLVGHDHVRDAVRQFNLKRITSPVTFTTRGPGPEFEVPDDFTVEEHLLSELWFAEEGVPVEVGFSPRIAWWIEQSLGLKADGVWNDWTLATLNVVDEEGFLSWVIGFGEDALVRSPAPIRDAVVTRLEQVITRQDTRPKTRRRAATTPAAAATRKAGRRAGGEDRGSLGRLERILLLVPYCVRNPGISVDDLAERFHTSRKEILADLDLVFMCGLPDYTPADLIDVVVEGGQVTIRMADYFAQPLRLTRSEAIPLYVKGHGLLDLLTGPSGAGHVAGAAQLDSLRSALSKLGQALLPQDGGVAELTERIKVHLEAGEAKWLPLLQKAVTERQRVDMEYYTYSRDTITRRKVDPQIVFASMGHWYVSCYCHLAQDRRMFRLDRVKSLEPTGETFDPPADAAEALPPPLLYDARPEDQVVRLRISSQVSTWLEEYYPMESVTQLRGGWREVTFRTRAFPWLEKLLLRFGGEVEIVEPAELSDRVRSSAARILALYRPQEPDA